MCKDNRFLAPEHEDASSTAQWRQFQQHQRQTQSEHGHAMCSRLKQNDLTERIPTRANRFADAKTWLIEIGIESGLCQAEQWGMGHLQEIGSVF